MNKRIKELLVQAIREIGPDDNDNGGKELTLQKFAELIIKECKMQVIAGACELELDANPFVDKITEHFKD